MAKERLQKLMARAGYGSRRSCEDIIEQGHVSVNGKIAKLGDQADPLVDDVRVKFEKLRMPDKMVYIMFNKPRGVISDEDVAGNWSRARDMIPLDGHLYPVGRLDIPSQGLMLFTNDGDLANKLSHPRYEHPKTYVVIVEGNPTDKALDTWRRGVLLDGEHTGPAEVRRMSVTRKQTSLAVTMHEGRKRQIRRIAMVVGYPVLSLTRVSLGPLQLGNLAEGSWRMLTDEELQSLAKVSQSAPRRRRLPVGASRTKSRQPQSAERTRRPGSSTGNKSKLKRGSKR